MTKHLRFLIVLLLTLVWSAGGAQTTIDFSNGLPTGWSKTGTIQKQTIDNKTCSQLQSSASVTSPAFEDAYSSMKISLTRSSNGTTFTISYQIGNAAAVLIKTYTSSQVTKGSWKDYIIDIPTAAQVANCKFIFKSDQASYYISSIEFTKAGPSKTPTKVAFPAEYSNKTFTFTEGKLEGFTAPTATETNNVVGTIKYSSNNESAVKVDASTGALSFPGYGEATITATFIPTYAETYAVSTDSYKVKNERGVVAGTITFDKANGAFDVLNPNNKGYGTAKYNFVSDTNESYTFDCNGVVKTLANNGCLQIQKNTGKVVSPTFPKFTNGYKVNIIYSSKKALKLSAGDANVVIGTTTKSNNTNGLGASVSISVPANVPFVITSGGSEVTYVSKIEIIPNKIDETETITLNETATNNNIVAKTGVNVTLKRTMAKGVWNTICLPFDVTYDVAQAAFGNDVKIAELDKTSTGTILSFKNVDAIKATIPYLIKPSEVKTSNEYVFENVNIDAANVNPYFSTTSSLAFVGIYNMVDITKNVTEVLDDTYYAAFLGANNTVYKANPVKEPGKETKGFRAYFAIPTSVKASELRVVIDGTATSIKNIDSEVVESNAPVYNLQGQRVDGNNLTPGIYVKAGKKFVVK